MPTVTMQDPPPITPPAPKWRVYTKAIAAATAAALGSAGSFAIVVPDSVLMPWWGYVIVGVLNGAVAGLVTALAPKNAEPR